MKNIILFLFVNIMSISVYSQIENDSLCSDIEKKIDKFSGEINYDSPSIDGISFVKNIKNGKTYQYVSIYIYDSYLSGYNNYGATILFESGKKIVRSKEKVDVNTSSGSDWSYSVFFVPTPNEIKLLQTEKIIGVKLYIFEKEVSGGDSIQRLSKCMLKIPIVKKKK